MRRITSLIFLFLLFACLPSYAQTQPEITSIKFKHLSLAEGLSQSCALSIIQDKRGFMWFGTQDGLNCYNGYEFKIFKNQLKKQNSISPGHITCMIEDHNGVIWLGTNGGGLNSYNPGTGIFTRYQNDPANNLSLTNNDITCLYEDKAGIIWIGTLGGGLNQLNPKHGEFLNYRHEQYNHRKLSNDRITGITMDANEVLWITTRGGGLNSFNTKNARFRAFHFDPKNEESVSSENLSRIIIDTEGYLWFGTENSGLCRMDPRTNTVKRYKHDENKPSSLCSNEVTNVYQDSKKRIWVCTRTNGICLYNPLTDDFRNFKNDPNDLFSLNNDYAEFVFEDKAGTIWVGTWGGGINYFNPLGSNFRVLQRKKFNDPKFMQSEDIWSIYEDGSGKLWIGTMGGGLNVLDTKKNEIKLYRHDPNNKESLISDDIISICKDKSGAMLFGTISDGLDQLVPEKNSFKHYVSDPNNPNNTQSIGSNRVRCIFEDNNGTTWVATNGGGLNVFNSVTGEFKRYKHDPKNPNSISSDNIQALYEDREGSLWIGTDRTGLNMFDAQNGIFKKFSYNADNPNSLSSNTVNAICQDHNGTVWIGTAGGLNAFNPQTQGFFCYTEQDGLPNNVIYSIVEDSKNNLWLTTNNGICRFTPPHGDNQPLIVKSYDSKDGLPSNEFNLGAHFKGRDGRLYFGGIKGIVYFHPDSLLDNPYVPPVYVTSLKVSEAELELDTVVSFKKNIVLTHEQNNLSFEFVGLNYIISEKNQYRYQMVGYDKNMINAGSRRYVHYTNLDPGEYEFKVKASNNDGVWNEEGTTIRITITPPWYRTYWFYAVALLLIIVIIFGFIKWRENKLKMQTKMLEKKVTERTRQLKREKDKVEEAYIEIGTKNKEITDSIKYAKRLQEAILPPDKEVKKYLPDSFILYKPKDIVSGDFYFFDHVDDGSKKGKEIIAVVDCTGHGVPGAFMSIVGNNLIKQAINEHRKTTPSEILDELNKGISETLRQTFEESTVKDGMDIALCSIDFGTNELMYSGAYNPLWILRKGISKSDLAKQKKAIAFGEDFLEVKANKFPVGAFMGEELKPFTNHRIPLEKGDRIYIFSDGYADQFGGEKGKKFKYKQLQEILLQLADEPMEEQKRLLDKTFENWKGSAEQLDDILVIGFRI